MNLTKSGFGTKIGTFGDGSRILGKMRPDPEISDREGDFGRGEGGEMSGEMMEMWDGVGNVGKNTKIYVLGRL